MSTTSVRTRPSPVLGLALVAMVVLLGVIALVTPSAAQGEPPATTVPTDATVPPTTVPTDATVAPTTVPNVPPTTVPPAPVPTTVPTAPPTTEAAPTTVQDVLLVGDSIMKSTGPALDRQLGSHYRVHNEGHNGSGLLTPQVFDWPAHLQSSLNRFDPDVVVMLMIGNYTDVRSRLWTTPQGVRIPDVYAPAFAREWGRQADRMVTTMIRSGAEVVLVLPPPMISPRVQTVTDRLRAEYRAVAARHPEVTLADATTAVGGRNGEWVSTRPTANGTPAPVRTADTVHLAAHGQDLVAREIRLGIGRARS